MINLFVLGKKGLDAIAGIHADLHPQINAVIIGKDSAVQNDYSSEIQTWAEQHQIQFYFRTEVAPLALQPAKLNVAIGWRWLISLEIPLIVFHDSILPKYRGFNPLVSALINGDSQIGVTALVGTDEFDQGDIVGQRIIPVQYPIKIEQAIDLISNEYALLLNEVLQQFIQNKLTRTPQDESQATFSLWRDADDYRIDWQQDSAIIKRTIDALGFPYQGASTLMDDVLVRIFDAQIVPDVPIVNRTAGKVLFKHDDGYVIVCGSGLLKVKAFYNEQGDLIHTNKFRIRFQ